MNKLSLLINYLFNLVTNIDASLILPFAMMFFATPLLVKKNFLSKKIGTNILNVMNFMFLSLCSLYVLVVCSKALLNANAQFLIPPLANNYMFMIISLFFVMVLSVYALAMTKISKISLAMIKANQ